MSSSSSSMTTCCFPRGRWRRACGVDVPRLRRLGVNDSDLMIKPAAGAKLFYLDDAGIVFCPATQELHLLNTTAAVIWTLMEEGHDAAGAASALREMYDLDAARAAEFVSTALDEWRRKRLLDGSLDAAESSPIVPMTLPPDRQMPWQPFDAVEEHHYLLLSSCLQVRAAIGGADASAPLSL